MYLPIDIEWVDSKKLMKFAFTDLDRGMAFTIYHVFKSHEHKIDYTEIVTDKERLKELCYDPDFKLRVKGLNTPESYFKENVTKKTLRQLLESIWTALFKKVRDYARVF